VGDRKTIVVIFESLAIRREVIQYAMALARRMDAGITLLMLLPTEDAPGERPPLADRLGERVLEREAARIAGGGVAARYEVVRGEPRSEFIKFMATRPSFHAAVWGGSPSALPHRSGRSSNHWIATIRNELNCPLVTPAKR